jgi:8-oxo-dGTP diphosphatase
LQTYSDPDRDPRGRVITTAYLALGADLPVPVAGTDAQDAHWVPVHNALCKSVLAFDHAVILREGLERARAKLEYTGIATIFCAEPFTLSELRRVYEVIWGLRIDPSNFRRKLTRAEGLLEPTGAFRTAATGRPAALYRRGPATLLMPPFLRAHNDSPPPWGEWRRVQVGRVP